MTVIEQSVVVQESIVIGAPPEAVWRLFSQIEQWPQWNPACIEAAYLSGTPWAAGSKFRYTIKQGRGKRRYKPTIVESKPPELVVWQVPRGQLTFRFEPEDAGARVTCRQVSSGSGGWGLPFLALPAPMRSSPHGVRETFKQWLAALKAEAERRS